MTVSEMLDQLKQKFVYVAPLSLPSETKEGLTGPFLFNVIKQIDDASVSNMTLKIYVKDLNMPTEEVLFDGYNPFKETTAPQTTFTQEVQEYIKTLTQAGAFDYATIEDTNEETERAFVWAYKIETNNVLTETALIIYRQEDGTLTHKEATTS
jgi:hypothetical protein